MKNKFIEDSILNIKKIKCLFYYRIILIIKPILTIFFSEKNVWLIGENSGVNLKDNGYCFLRYCIEKENRKNVYLIIKKNTFDFENSTISRRFFLEYYSFKHILYLIFSNVLLFTHTHRDIIFHTLFPLIKHNKRIIFLKHGVTGFKRFHDRYKKDRDEMDILVSVSQFEKKILHQHLGVKSEKIQIVGYPRHDYLLDNSSTNKQIVYMPTWRDWLDVEDPRKTSFYAKINSFLHNPHLHKLLNTNDVVLKLYLHVIMKHFSTYFSTIHHNIQVVSFGEESVQDLIAFSSLLITDYSSVSWDFLYLNKPTIFYQFDKRTYLTQRGSYLDLENNLFGESTSNEAELITIINNCINNNFKSKNNSNTHISSFFEYKDRSNCNRLYKKIITL